MLLNNWIERRPVCDQCGHTACPHCGDWCDVLLAPDDPEWDAEKAGGPEERYPCCAMQCVYQRGRTALVRVSVTRYPDGEIEMMESDPVR